MKTSATDMMKCYFITLWNTTLSKLTCRLATCTVLSSVPSMILTLSINKSYSLTKNITNLCKTNRIYLHIKHPKLCNMSASF